jgi:hypothetical protein
MFGLNFIHLGKHPNDLQNRSEWNQYIVVEPSNLKKDSVQAVGWQNIGPWKKIF